MEPVHFRRVLVGIGSDAGERRTGGRIWRKTELGSQVDRVLRGLWSMGMRKWQLDTDDGEPFPGMTDK